MLTIPLLGSAAASATLPGTIELMVLTAGGILPRRPIPAQHTSVRKLAVVIPAHNEAGTIEQCIQSLQTADFPNTTLRVVTVADNCTDETAALAAKAGVEVLVRNDDSHRGKGFALEFAFEKLLKDPEVDAFLIVDADTIVSPNFLVECEKMFVSGADGVQSRYLVKNSDESDNSRLMNTALLAFNVLRPRGRDRFGFSVGILGNGWGLSRRCLEKVPYHARSVVEDLEYHIRLVREGMRIRFVDTATVYGEMPTNEDAAASQRSRWEGGRLRMIREQIPALIKDLLCGKLRAVEPAGELLLLPLSYHIGGLLIALLIPFPLSQLYAVFGLGLVAFHIGAAIAVGGGSMQDLKALSRAPRYIFWKIALFKQILAASSKNQDWIRTGRGQENN